jgi:hypothetical protein
MQFGPRQHSINSHFSFNHTLDRMFDFTTISVNVVKVLFFRN